MHWTVLDLESTLIHIKYFYVSLRLLCNQVCYLSILIFTFTFYNEDTGTQSTRKYLQSSRLPMKIIQVKKLVKPFKYCKDKISDTLCVFVIIKSTERFLSFVAAKFQTYFVNADFLTKSQTNEQ